MLTVFNDVCASCVRSAISPQRRLESQTDSRWVSYERRMDASVPAGSDERKKERKKEGPSAGWLERTDDVRYVVQTERSACIV